MSRPVPHIMRRVNGCASGRTVDAKVNFPSSDCRRRSDDQRRFRDSQEFEASEWRFCLNLTRATGSSPLSGASAGPKVMDVQPYAMGRRGRQKKVVEVTHVRNTLIRQRRRHHISSRRDAIRGCLEAKHHAEELVEVASGLAHENFENRLGGSGRRGSRRICRARPWGSARYTLQSIRRAFAKLSQSIAFIVRHKIKLFLSEYYFIVSHEMELSF
jgi:hypothetical protein